MGESEISTREILFIFIFIKSRNNAPQARYNPREKESAAL